MPPALTDSPPPASTGVGRRDPALDGLRGLAILLVYVFHYGGGLTSSNTLLRLCGYFTQAGWIGVDIFFALSGFLITRLFWADRGTPGCVRYFYARRALRVLPLYLGALAIAAVAAVFGGAQAAALRPILLYAAFLQNVPPFLSAALHYPPPLPLYHLWSLAVEEQFYVIWPLLLLACKNRGRALYLCVCCFLLCCLFRNFVWGPVGAILGTPPLEWSITLPGRSGALALGGALALLPRAWAPRLRQLAPWALLLSLTGFISVGAAEHGLLLNNRLSMILGLPCAEVFAVSLVASIAAQSTVPGPWRSLLSTRPLRALGRISYGFYVFHILLEPWFDRIGRLATHTTHGMTYQLVRLLVAFPISAGVAALSYYAYETPFLRLKRRFPHRANSGPGAVRSTSEA